MKAQLLIAYVDKEIQLKFQGDMQPVGPVKLEIVQADGRAPYQLFRINLPAMMGDPRQGRQVQVVLPIDFDADAVVWVSEGPKNADGEQLVHEIQGPGKRTSGGLVIP